MAAESPSSKTFTTCLSPSRSLRRVAEAVLPQLAVLKWDDGDVTNSSRPTIYDVAARAGVSKSLVSLVLREPGTVSERRRRAVLEAIDELGYRPSSAAASLAGTRTRTIGMVVEDFANLWFVDLLQGLREVLKPEGLQVLMGDRQMTMSPGRDAIDAFVSMRVEGLVLALDPPDVLTGLHGIPAVVAGERGRHPRGVAKVANDDRSGARLATRHLIELGHTRIAHVTGEGGAAQVRREAYEATMTEAGLEPVVVGHGNPTNDEAATVATRELLAARRDVTAIFAANDAMGLGCMGALREVGLSVPDDVSIVGYDNSLIAQAAYLDMTTVDDRSLDVGRETARVLLDRIGGATTEASTLLLTPSLIVRSTTRPAAR
ncbi:LacI family DNA-binding transcriptional regulator [Aeromicrobium yanjiei]|uniref:LacI family DNA-binding transcriptional regulator n=1 Tax=Aeromicrobium yanjiei TaxID=2662028 RepID=A0A5Q2MFE4_9ACTN|nr:LacI family DNA-binding transcriptional regulator [Aeromicrobium yanjiei]